MRVGFYKDELEDFGREGYNDVNDVAEFFATFNHQIDEASDMEFTVFVEDDEGVLHKVSMHTEYDPVFWSRENRGRKQKPVGE